MADGFVTAQISFPGVKLKVESEVRESVFIVETTEFSIRFEAYPAFFSENCLFETRHFIHKCLRSEKYSSVKNEHFVIIYSSSCHY